VAGHENIATLIRGDLAVFRAILSAGLAVNDSVLKGIWRWFSDVELMVPLPVMELTEAERSTLAWDIVAEMDELFAELESSAACAAGDALPVLAGTEHGRRVNLLWKELAGCYPLLINAEIPVLPPRVRAVLEGRIVHSLAEQYQVDEAEVRRRLRTDEMLRMTIRMAGLDPDRIS
jgi:hypothetical protein